MTSAEIFDRAVYNTLLSELGRDDVAAVLAAFLADTSGKLERLSVQAPDRLIVKSEAHALKSSSATFGFFDLSRLAKEVEAQAERMSPAELTDAVERLRDSFVRVRRLAETILPVSIEEL